MIETSYIHRPSVLRALIDKCGGLVETLSGDVSALITSIEYNSTRVRKGSLFVAVKGFAGDGHVYINDALERGAAAVLVSGDKAGMLEHLEGKGITLLASADSRRALSKISAAFYRNPTGNMPVVGVTGTNGKTSITYMLESIFALMGFTPGVVGTVNYRWKAKNMPAPNTTPESRDLQELAASMAADGVDFLIMEVSSHGLKLNRVEDIEFNTGIFTNLTRDHMDFHPDFEDYFSSKKRLFELLNGTPAAEKYGIVNRDDPYGEKILSSAGIYGYPLLGFGLHHEAEYRPVPGSVINSIEGIRYIMEKPLKDAEVRLNVAGGFHVGNSLCALAAAHVMGAPVEKILEGLGRLTAIPGRFDRISSPSGFHVIVDYAHTGDALEKLLATARELARGRVITLFGCGGDRDRTKRPLMGNVASRLSDMVIVTSDNPRTENPDSIIGDILPGIDGADYEVEPDREKAIRKAVELAAEGDIVVVAGKGHEDYQIIGREKRHFDDHEIVRKYVSLRDGR